MVFHNFRENVSLWMIESLESKKEKHAFWILISDFHNMDHDEYVEDDLGSSVSSYTDEVQLSRSMENGNFTCGLLIFFSFQYTLKQVQIRQKVKLL